MMVQDYAYGLQQTLWGAVMNDRHKEFVSWAKELSEKLDKLGLGFMWHKPQEM